MIRIGYQGIEGSNSEAAAFQIVKDLGWVDVTYVPLVDSRTVINALRADDVDYGVLATENTLGGPVRETKEALSVRSFESIAQTRLKITQALFKKPGVANEDITCIASHEQALLQTAGKREQLFPNSGELAIKDTAIGARYLAEGTLLPSTAVICSRTAGELHGLELIADHFEDDENNYTTFKMVKRFR